MGIVSNIVKGNTDINDKVLFASSLAAAAGGAKGYLAAILVCTTPELRAFYSTQLSQCLMGHSALVDLGVKKGWLEPSMSPLDGLKYEIDKLNCLFDNDK